MLTIQGSYLFKSFQEQLLKGIPSLLTDPKVA